MFVFYCVCLLSLTIVSVVHLRCVQLWFIAVLYSVNMPQFSTVLGIFGSLLDNYEEFLCEPSVTCTVVYVVFPVAHAQEWNDWIIEFNYLQLYQIIPNFFLKSCFHL